AFHLHNSQDLVLEQTEITSTPTYYVGAQGKELDYILLSNEFSDCSDQARGIVTDYQVIDSHLVNPRYGHDHISTDHGIVTVNISII
ncbi:endonuclease/exonuclease/phosphatase family protein, partial [Vibrio genomosp. F10 str. 9ZC157]